MFVPEELSEGREYASARGRFRGVDDAFQTRECRQEGGQNELERILDPDAGRQSLAAS